MKGILHLPLLREVSCVLTGCVNFPAKQSLFPISFVWFAFRFGVSGILLFLLLFVAAPCPVSGSGQENTAIPGNRQEGAGNQANHADPDIRQVGTGPLTSIETRARAIVEIMTDSELAGQVLMMTWPGETPPGLMFDWIEKRGLGGVKVFGWNGKDVVALSRAIEKLQKSALAMNRAIPLLVATDQEGGTVRHIKDLSSRTAGAMSIGATNSAQDARKTGEFIGRELAALGVNMNFAPVVDLATRPDSHIIGPRAFSDDPGVVARLASSFAQGLSNAGVIPVIKHFPGHGDTVIDSHGKLPSISINRATMNRRELLPFAVLTREGIPAVMAGHLAFPEIDPSRLPASASRYFLVDVLRKELKFKGVTITDDLFMHGSGIGAKDPGKAAIRAIRSGIDILMLSSLLEWNSPIYESLVTESRTDPEFRSRLKEAATRILSLKYARLEGKREFPLVPDSLKVTGLVPAPGAAAFFRDQARRAATLVSGKNFPALTKSDKPLVISPFPEFSNLASLRFPGSRVVEFSYRPLDAPRAQDVQKILPFLEKGKAALVLVPNASGAALAKRAIDAGMKVRVIATDSPFWALPLSDSSTVVAVYGDFLPSLEAGLDVLTGSLVPSGHLPFVPKTK